MYYALDRYPIEELTAALASLTAHVWEKARDRAGGPQVLCVSGFLAPFRHLTLAEGFQLYAYRTRGYHGFHGDTAAIENGEPFGARLGGLDGLPTIQLPENAIDPLEVVHCDGTPEGYLEAVLFRELLWTLPRLGGGRALNSQVLFRPPERSTGSWDWLFQVDSWCPKVKGQVVYCYVYEQEDWQSPFFGQDRISLQACSFPDRLDMARALGMPSSYPRQLPGAGRDQKGRHCCVFARSSICIAQAPDPR